MQDAFRARVLFPIFSENGEAVAIGGRILPGSADPAKYKNSPETPIYTKSKTLYGLNWAKADIVNSNQVIVCEGYTDVIGFHRAGLPRAVATCGTAFTEEHVRLLKSYASRVVLAFDADNAGQGAAERFYEWEEKYQVEVQRGARSRRARIRVSWRRATPARSPRRSSGAKPFLGFRLDRVLQGQAPQSPEAVGPPGRAGDVGHQRAPERRTSASCTPARWRSRSGMPVNDLVAHRRAWHAAAAAGHACDPRSGSERRENAEFVGDRAARAELGPDRPVARRGAVLRRRLPPGVPRRRRIGRRPRDGARARRPRGARGARAGGRGRRRTSTPRLEARNLIGAAVRRELASASSRQSDPDVQQSDRDARVQPRGAASVPNEASTRPDGC